LKARLELLVALEIGCSRNTELALASKYGAY